MNWFKSFSIFTVLLTTNLIFSQTYTSSLGVGNYTNCSTSALTANCGSPNFQYTQSTTYFQFAVTSISGSNIQFTIKRCNSSALFTNVTLYIKEQSGSSNLIQNVVCGNNHPTSGIVVSGNGQYSYTVNYNATNNGFTSGTRRFVAIAILNNGTRYYTNHIDLTATQVQLPDLIIQDFSISPPELSAGEQMSVTNRIRNIGTGSSPSTTVGYYLSDDNVLSANDIFLGSQNYGALSPNSLSPFQNINLTIPSNTTPGLKYLISKVDHNNLINESNENNNVDAMLFTVLQPTLPTIRAESCFQISNATFNAGENLTGSITVRNTPSNLTWYGYVRIFISQVTNSANQINIHQQNLTLVGGASQTINFSAPVQTASTYRIWARYSNSPNGGEDFIVNFGCLTCSGSGCLSTTTPTQLINVTSHNVQCVSVNVNPTSPQQGQNATISAQISNSGTGNYTPSIAMYWKNLSTNVETQLGSSINGLNAGASHTFPFTFSPMNHAAGQYQVIVKSSTGIVFCSQNVTVTAQPPTCVQGSGNPPAVGSDAWNATQYLCQNNIIQPQQNWTNNFEWAILRQDLAKITYNGLYMNVPENQRNSPAKNFPVPFLDMQNQFTGNEYWFDAAKVLAYLQFSDDRTPFDRDFTNFRPTDPIERRFAIKMFLEAFNITPSTSTINPFSDVDVNDEMFKWIKRAHELGIVLGNTVNCGSGTCFHPYANLTRQDAFIILHRILIFTTITKPTTTQLNSNSSSVYFFPGNYRVANFGGVPDLDHANFNHYVKTSFNIDGRSSIPLEFTHTYNSYLTELPKSFFTDGGTNPQHFMPIGRGWTHSYNIYGVKIDGYSNGTHTEPPKIMFFYPDGSINVFNYNTNAPEGIGVYDQMTKTPISGGEQITIKTKSQVKYVFENVNNGKFFFIRSIRDRNNNGVQITWSSISNNRFRISQVREIFTNNTLGRTLTFNYSTAQPMHLSSVTDASINRTISFNVNATTGNLTSFTDAKGQVTQYTYGVNTNYNTAGLLTEIQLPKGNKIKNNYQNRKLTSTQTLNQANVATSTVSVNWTPSYGSTNISSSATVTDPSNRTTTYQHNALGNPTSIAAPTGTTTVNNYAAGNNANLPTSLTINGIGSSISYDNNGNVLSLTKNGITNSFTYNSFNDVLTNTNGNGFTTTYTYDANGNLSSVIRPSGGGTITISRNTFGQMTSVTNPSGITTNYSYNANGLQNQITMPLGITTSATYDNASRLLSVTDANGKTTTYQYDLNDNLVQSTDANGQITQHTYDANDNHLTIKNPKNETQTMTYNFADDLLTNETFGVHSKGYTYNADGSLATHTRGNGTFTYSYHATTGRLTSDGHTSYTYDTRGNVKTIVNANGTLTLNYDNNDRMTSYSDYFGNTVAYQYDNNNNITKITYPGNKQVNYAYDGNNRCTTVTDWNNKVTTYTYLTDDRISQITLPNGSYTQYSYDVAGRMTGLTNLRSNGTVISSYAFTLDNGGNHTSETVVEPALAAGLLTLSNQNVNYGNYPFNRIQSQGSTSFTHNTAGAITNKGSETFTYNIYDQMLTAPGRSYTYDGAGNRRSKTVGGTTTRYVLSILGMSQVLMETNASNTPTNFYVYGPTGLLYRVSPSNQNSYYHYDFRGSTTAITNESQTISHSYSYDPFGKVLASTEADANPFQYVGRYGVQFETTTLTYMRARYYDPTTGRFVSEDPVWHLNLYPYADNNPISFIDADGNNPIALAKIFALSVEFGVIGGLGLIESNNLLAASKIQINQGIRQRNLGNHRIALGHFELASKFAKQSEQAAREAKIDMINLMVAAVVDIVVDKGVTSVLKTRYFKTGHDLLSSWTQSKMKLSDPKELADIMKDLYYALKKH